MPQLGLQTEPPAEATGAAGRRVGLRPGGLRPVGDRGSGLPAGAPSSALRRAILDHLRRAGPSSPDRLATEIGASRTGVLQQLRALESANLVRHAAERHGVGRPRHVYEVTPDAQDLFPANYDGLASGLIEAILAIGGEDLVEQVFAARRRQIGDRVRSEMAARLPSDASLEDRARELAVIQDEQGYLGEALLLPDGTLTLREHNCAIYHVARGAPAACAAELELFREVLDANVVREEHIVAGGRCCSYRISAAGE